MIIFYTKYGQFPQGSAFETHSHDSLKNVFGKKLKKKFKSLNQAQQYKKKSAKSLGLESFDNLLPLFILSGFCLEKGKTYIVFKAKSPVRCNSQHLK